jgi:N-acetyl-gamma-glutamyl-phosphate reductase
VLSMACQRDVQVVFTPHLIPMDRGILTSAYARPLGDLTEERLLATLRAFYAGKPFIRVVEHLPATKDVAGSNFCDITVRLVRGCVVVFSCIDNLVKGASGAAVQNFNLMYGFPETVAF